MPMSRIPLLAEVESCTLCQEHLPYAPRPILQVHPAARILVASQAPGRRAHLSGIPFDDASGERLRDWMGITPEQFYARERVAILPMGFCYPGKGKSGDLPPRRECAPVWRERLLAGLPNLELTLVIGQYAQAWHLRERPASLTETVRSWRDWWPAVLPLPHPSPLNNLWLRRNPWFEEEVVPRLRERVAAVLELC
jgi:uracil-DNA glycosylase